MVLKRKIAILADFPLHSLPYSRYPAPSGHYATWFPQLAKAFERETDFEIHWLTLDSSVEAEKMHTAWNQIFHVLPTWRRGRAATMFYTDRQKIHRKLCQISPDLVHGWGNENIWGWATVSSGRKHIFSIQGLLGFYSKLGHIGMRERLMALIESRVLRKALVITAESPWAIEHVTRLYGRKDVRMVEYGVPQQFFEAGRAPDLNNPYAVMIGTADYRKGIDFAVQLFAKIELAGIRLKVVGGLSPFGIAWKKNSPENIEWLGRKNQNEIIKLMTGATCLVLPTRGDTGPSIAKEALVIGLPILASPNGGHTQYIEDKKNGFICSLERQDLWIEKLLQLFLKKDDSLTKSKILFKRIRTLLRPERTAQEFGDLYRSMLEHIAKT